MRDFENVRAQLLVVVSIAGGFLVGAAIGAMAFATIGLRGALLAVGIVAGLTVWAFQHRREA